MELVGFRILYLWMAKKSIKNKMKEFQINFYLYLSPVLNFNIDLRQDFDLFNIDIDIFNLFKLSLVQSKECDHAGFIANLSVLGLEFSYTKYDIRHWDNENNSWCVYSDDIRV